MSDVWLEYWRSAKGYRMYPCEEMIRFVGKYLLNVKQEERKYIKIMEIGCGNGCNIWPLAKEGFDVYGIDISENALRLADGMKRKWDVEYETRQVNLLDECCYDDGSFDVIIDVVSMQHLSFGEHARLYDRIHKLLKPGGLFYTYHRNDKSWDFAEGDGELIDYKTYKNIPNSAAPFSNLGVICMLSNEDMKNVIAKQGFEILDSEIVSKSYNDCRIIIYYNSVVGRKYA